MNVYHCPVIDSILSGLKCRVSSILYFKCFDNRDVFIGTRFTEPLQKLMVRLGTCEIGLSPPVILYY